MRWLMWLGGLATVGGLWLLFRGVDVAAGKTDDLSLYVGVSLFLLGMVLMGWGLGTGRNPET